MYCADCGTRNADGTTYCVECGIRLAAADEGQTSVLSIAPEPRSLQALVARAYDLREAGELEAAIEMCRRAIAIEPRSRAAHSLLGLLYEDKGQPAFAIREYRVVLEIDPRSAAEREKLEMLLAAQREEDTTSLRPVAPSGIWRRWRVAIVSGAAGAAIIVVAVAVQLARTANRTPPPAHLPVLGAIRDGGTGQSGGPGAPGGVGVNAPPYPVKAAGELFAPPTTWKAEPPVDPRHVPLLRTPRDTMGTVRVPPVEEGTRAETFAARDDVSPPLPPPPVPPVPGSPGDGAPMITPVPEPLEKPGLIRIEVTTPASERHGPMITPVRDVPVPSASGDAQAGQERQLAALRRQREGRFQEAISQYQSAIEAYEREVASGGATRATQQAIETCKRGIEFCRSKLSGS